MIAFAHVSDLHFGEVLANQSPGKTLHQNPHALSICLALPSALADARALVGLGHDDPVNVVASGDLTLAGGAEEFAVGHLFLRSRARISRAKIGQHFGLNIEDDRLASVPGNHDHWRGRRGKVNYAKGVPAFTKHVHGTHFLATPWQKAWSCPKGSMSIELFGVDSSSGLAGQRASYRQRGSISKAEFEALETLLATAPTQTHPVARAIVCHHSLHYRGGIFGTAELEPASRNELIRLAGFYGVAAILTGHTHDFVWKSHDTVDAHGTAIEVMELRAATTVTIGEPLNGFLLHRIEPTGAGQWTWSGWSYTWNSVRFMRRARTPCFKFSFP
jgi:hypothetical protein